MQYVIQGELAQTVSLVLEAGDWFWASKGALTAYDPLVEWSLKVPGGVTGAARRMLSGESMALTLARSNGDGAQAILSSNQPGKIIAWKLQEGPVIATRGSFVGAFGADVHIDVIVARRPGAAFFGGAGLFLQKVSGSGTAFVHGAGDFIEQELAANQELLVSTGSLAAFSDQVDYSIVALKGLRKMFFGGEGIFMTKLTGPGRVLLQSLKRESRGGKGGRSQ